MKTNVIAPTPVACEHDAPLPEVDSAWMGLGPPAPSPAHEAFAGEAAVLAEFVHEEMFSSRRGVIELRERRLVVLYDNSPFADRSARASWLRRVLVEARGQAIALVGHAAYPTTGEDPGYTVVLIFQRGSGAQVHQLAEAALAEVLRER